MSPSLEKYLVLIIQILIILLAGIGIYFFISYFWPLITKLVVEGIKVIIPVLIAFFFASILNPMVTLLEQRAHIPRTWGTLFTLFGFLAVIGGLLFLLISSLIRELIQLSYVLASLSQDLETWNFNLLVEKLREFLINLRLPSNLVQETISNLWQIVDILKNIIGIILAQLFRFIASLPRSFVLLIITILATFFFARDYHLIKANLIRLIPHRWQTPFVRVTSDLLKALHGFVRAQLLLISLTGFETLIGLSVLGVDYAHILALVVAFVDLLPILGPGTLYLPWAVWVLFSGNLRLGIGLIVLYGIIVVVRQLLEPKVVGQSIGLYPLTTLITIYFGFSLLGVWGLILGPAVVVAYKALFEGERTGKT